MVEERPANKGPTALSAYMSSSQMTEPSASWQRDLDDPALADGVSPHEVSMRRRKLYAQADDSGESMAENSCDSRDEDEL